MKPSTIKCSKPQKSKMKTEIPKTDEEIKTDVLRGRVRNYAERDEAERVAGCAPGVTSVDNQLAVKWFWLAN